MCGIVGIYCNNSINYEVQLGQMMDSIVHRGPDAAGQYVGKNVLLGHRRLSIIDLSDRANQPMFSHSGRTVMVFNGEVYNYREIASQLNISTNTHSDSEVIVEAFEQLGPDFVKMLNGMFSIVFCDVETQRLFFFRDRLGVKPLFYYQQNGVFAFASELKAIEKLSDFQCNKSINKSAVGQFLHLGYIPQPNTIYNNVYKFPQGCWAEYDGSGLHVHNYWSLNDFVDNPVFTSETPALDYLQELIESSVSYRLIADVPFGTFLSGGIDSSLVTAVANKVSGGGLNTFSIGFDDAKHDESEKARAVAKALGTNHHEYRMTRHDAIDQMADMFSYYDEPYADSSALPSMLVSKMARQQVAMVLTGDGGDELFMGYGMYNWAQRLQNPLARTLRKPIYLASKLLNDRWKRIGLMFDWQKSDFLPSHIFSQEQYLFSANDLQRFVGNKPDVTELKKTLSVFENLTAAEQQSVFDMLYYLPDDLLTKVDRASMRYSLESRVPLLDYRVVEFAAGVPVNMKIRNGEQKYLLKQLLYRYLPEELFNAPKWGFSVPLADWLLGELLPLRNKYLNRDLVEAAGLVNYSSVEDLCSKFYFEGQRHLYNRVWALICLHQWYANRMM